MTFPLKRVRRRGKKATCDGGGGGAGRDVIEGIIRLAADAFEERALGMYEGFIVSVKEHIENLLEIQKRELLDKMRQIGKPGGCERWKMVKEGNVRYLEAVLCKKSIPLVGEPTSKGASSDNNNGGQKPVGSHDLNLEKMQRSEIYPNLGHSLS
ncbi:unnamed protein product [Arabis nemorensis]|uniref:Uncharacterized protein n=1 Tax=Arabis nemorensis TaxID=586526 RepID=A0A565C3P5_9BRAS|nr:unnamed protein product [Arabis nemorensis]